MVDFLILLHMLKSYFMKANNGEEIVRDFQLEVLGEVLVEIAKLLIFLIEVYGIWFV